jgi:hypothetical protein
VRNPRRYVAREPFEQARLDVHLLAPDSAQQALGGFGQHGNERSCGEATAPSPAAILSLRRLRRGEGSLTFTLLVCE